MGNKSIKKEPHYIIELNQMRKYKIVFLLSVLLQSNILRAETCKIEDVSEIRQPQIENTQNSTSTNTPISPSEVEDFAASPFKLKNSKAQVPVDTRLRIGVVTEASANKSSIGDRFEARVLEDFYLSGDFRKLIVPKHSWIKGKVSAVKKPGLLSRSGKLGIKLDSLITPQGDYVPLDADLVFVEGAVNQEGLLDPQTGFSDKAMNPTQNLLKTNAGKAVSVATLGVPVIGTLIGGSAIALFSHGDSAIVNKGDELQIVLTQSTTLSE